MERAERSAIFFFISGVGVAMVASAGPLAFPDAPRELWRVIFVVGALVAILPALFLGYEYRHIAQAKRALPLIGMIVFGIGFLACAAWYFWPARAPLPATATEQPPKVEPLVVTPKPAAQPNGINKYIVDGLTKARDDLLNIKKGDLSCAALSAWQQRADAATRLAHAHGIGIHNTISQYVGACGNITDHDEVDAIRENIVQILNQGIQGAGG